MVREEEDALAGGVAASRRLEPLLRVVEDLLVDALRASLRALEELEVGAQSLDDLVAVLR